MKLEEWESGESLREYVARQKARREARREAYLQSRRTEGDPGIFLKEASSLCRDRCGAIPSRRLYELYTQWCMEENLLLVSSRSFFVWMKAHEGEDGIHYTGYVTDSQGKRTRGYRGIRESMEQICI